MLFRHFRSSFDELYPQQKANNEQVIEKPGNFFNLFFGWAFHFQTENKINSRRRTFTILLFPFAFQSNWIEYSWVFLLYSLFSSSPLSFYVVSMKCVLYLPSISSTQSTNCYLSLVFVFCIHNRLSISSFFVLTYNFPFITCLTITDRHQAQSFIDDGRLFLPSISSNFVLLCVLCKWFTTIRLIGTNTIGGEKEKKNEWRAFSTEKL